jgi:hypothetical protein
MLLIPQDMPVTDIRSGWIIRENGALLFCGETCSKKGPPDKVREALTAHVSYRRGAPALELLGMFDAVNGYDALSANPDYLLGHKNGMGIRPVIEEAQKQLAEMQAGKESP